MGTERDLSFDYAERVKGDTLNGLEYSKVPGSLTSDKAVKGEHFHFWVPADLTQTDKRFLTIAEAYRQATNKFTVASASWDFVPATGERKPSQQRTQRRELFLIDWRREKRPEYINKHQLGNKCPDFEVIQMINTTQWCCGVHLTVHEVDDIITRGDVTVHIELPRLYKITKVK